MEESDEDGLGVEESIGSFLKTKLCVFCALPVDRDDGEEETPPISEDTFLQGISVLCDVINAEEDCKRFANLEEWALHGMKDFVGFVCCGKCGELIDQIVSLHLLVTSIQASLKENVRKIGDSMVESEERISGGHMEYSVTACLQFRTEFLNSFSRTQLETPKVTKIESLGTYSRTRSKISSYQTQPNTLEDSEPPSPQKLLFSTPFVKLERLNLSCETNHGAPISNSEPLSPPSDFDDDNNPDPSPPELENDSLNNLKNDGDDDYRPVPKRKRGKGYKKAGRPRIHPKVDKIPGKRGRPPKSNADDNKDKPSRRTRKPLKMETDEEVPGDKRGRRARNAPKIIDTGNTTDETSDNEDEEEYLPSDNDEEFIPESSSGASSKRSRTSAPPSKTQQSETTLQKKKRGRPPLTDIRRYRPLPEEGLKHHKPIYLISPSLLMFFNVPFQRHPHFLQCLHPSCTHTEPFNGYFTDQLTFLNFRFHVRHHHRQPYKFVNSSQNFYYCHLCTTHFTSRDSLAEHKRALHPNSSLPPTLCEVCGATQTINQIVKHTISHKNSEEKKFAIEQKRKSGKPKDITKPLQFPCDECGKIFKNHTELRIHKPSHVPIEVRKNFMCDICGGKFVNSNSLEHHKRRVHLRNLPTPNVCKICGKTFLACEKSKFDDHQRMHSGVKPFQCPTCGKSFHSKWSLTVHERLHQDTSVTCEYCSKIYKNERYLKRHHVKHHKEIVGGPDLEESKIFEGKKEDFVGPKQRFPCEPCGHQFIYKSMLVAHMKGKHNMELENRQDYPVMWTMEDQNRVSSQGNSSVITSVPMKEETNLPHPLGGERKDNILDYRNYL